MSCHVCKRSAVGHCESCGKPYCPEHGDVFCVRCLTAVASSGHSVQRGGPRIRLPRIPTWREDDEEEDEPPPPPACYQCGGPPQHICRRCEQLYCAAHAGRADMCAACTRASWVGLWISLGTLLAIVAIILLMALLDRQSP